MERIAVKVGIHREQERPVREFCEHENAREQLGCKMAKRRSAECNCAGANGIFAFHFGKVDKYSEHSCSVSGGIGLGQYKYLAFLRHTARFYLTDSKLYPEMVFNGFYPVLRIATGSFTP